MYSIQFNSIKYIYICVCYIVCFYNKFVFANNIIYIFNFSIKLEKHK